MDPNVVELAQKIAAFLLPFLPHLLKVGDKAAEEVGKKIGGEGWERAKALWDKLRRKKNVEQVAQTVAALPDNQALLEALREEIARALAEDPALRAEITTIYSRVKVGDVEAGGKVTGVKAAGATARDNCSVVSVGMWSLRVLGTK